MNDKIKLGILSIRDDTTIMDISGKHSDYIFSTRDNPALFDVSNDAADDLIVIYEGSPEYEENGGIYSCIIESSYSLDKDKITELYVTIAGHEEIAVPKNTYAAGQGTNTFNQSAFNQSVSVFGELDTTKNIPIFINYPIAIDISASRYLSCALQEQVSSIVIKAHKSELYIPEGTPIDPPPGE